MMMMKLPEFRVPSSELNKQPVNTKCAPPDLVRLFDLLFRCKFRVPSYNKQPYTNKWRMLSAPRWLA